jgi:hypothetical protein
VTSKSRHFSVEQWADFARGLLGGPARLPLEKHLEECLACRNLVTWIQKVSQVSPAAPEPPSDVLAQAKSLFASRALGSAAALPRRTARLVHDTLRDPLPAGVRSTSPSTRHALFEAGNYLIDVRMERDRHSRQISLTGQLASKKEPDKIFSSLPVLLFQGENVVCRTASNDQGEFCFDTQARRNLRVVIPAPEVQIEIRLGELTVRKS